MKNDPIADQIAIDATTINQNRKKILKIIYSIPFFVHNKSRRILFTLKKILTVMFPKVCSFFKSCVVLH